VTLAFDYLCIFRLIYLNIAYYPAGDREITGDRSSKIARLCKKCLMLPKIITYLQKLAQVTRLYIPKKSDKF